TSNENTNCLTDAHQQHRAVHGSSQISPEIGSPRPCMLLSEISSDDCGSEAGGDQQSSSSNMDTGYYENTNTMDKDSLIQEEEEEEEEYNDVYNERRKGEEREWEQAMQCFRVFEYKQEGYTEVLFEHNKRMLGQHIGESYKTDASNMA